MPPEYHFAKGGVTRAGFILVVVVLTIGSVAGGTVMAQCTKDVGAPSPLVAIENEPPAKLIVDRPLPGPLASGRVLIQYRAENMRIMPVFDEGALTVSPRVGHVHITVDDAPWHFVDASGETIILVGLLPGPHRVLIELVDPLTAQLLMQSG